MPLRNRLPTCLLLLGALLLTFAARAPQVGVEGAAPDEANAGPAAASSLYLPIVFRDFQDAPARRVHAPYFNDTQSVTGVHFNEMAIFWFGKVTQSENYADVRVGYNNSDLYVNVAAFDRRLWYDTSPSAGDLTAWDGATLYLNLTGNVGEAPSANAYRLDAQFNLCSPSSPTCLASYRAAYRGNGSGWGSAALTFTGDSGWRGDYPNNNVDDRGWVMTFEVPFASLGLSGPPAQGTTWGLAVVLHDRDNSSASPPIADKTWPESNVDAQRPITWGKLGFGLPAAYVPPAYTSPQTVTLREGLSGAGVPDAAVGGTGGNLCGSGTDFWTQWGNINHGSDGDFAIQNQSDISDFPCFAKYYVTFPLISIPAGKVIVSATLTLHQMGGSGQASNGEGPFDELIQVMSVNEDWNESTITWNNAPLALENHDSASRTWVGTVVGCGSSIAWPCVPRTWNVSRAVAQAYAVGSSARLVLYSANSEFSTGKYFTSSETGAWNAVGRPTLQVTYGNP